MHRRKRDMFARLISNAAATEEVVRTGVTTVLILEEGLMSSVGNLGYWIGTGCMTIYEEKKVQCVMIGESSKVILKVVEWLGVMLQWN